MNKQRIGEQKTTKRLHLIIQVLLLYAVLCNIISLLRQDL